MLHGAPVRFGSIGAPRLAAVLRPPRLALMSCPAGFGAACGAADEGRREATLALDFQPNAVHSGIYAAERGARRAPAASTSRSASPPPRPTRSSCWQPGAPTWPWWTSTTSASRASRAATSWESALSSQRPLAAVIARAGEVRRPRDLEGRRVGVTGLPSDEAVLRAVVEDDGGDSERVGG